MPRSLTSSRLVRSTRRRSSASASALRVRAWPCRWSAADGPVEGRREVVAELRDGRVVAVQLDVPPGVVRGERQAPAQRLVGDDAERVDVGLRTGAVGAAEQLRGHVGARAEGRVRRRQPAPGL
jgi:hypothetical protein